MLALLVFVAVLGAIIVGWMAVDEGVVLLTWALLLAVATAAKIYDESMRTRLGAASMERDGGESLYASVPVLWQRVRTITGIAALAFAVAAAGILGYSLANAGTEKDDDDDDEQSAAIVYILASEEKGAI